MIQLQILVGGITHEATVVSEQALRKLKQVDYFTFSSFF